MAKNRELSQVGSLVTVNDSTGQVGIANSVGINTTQPTLSYALDVAAVHKTILGFMCLTKCVGIS